MRRGGARWRGGSRRSGRRRAGRRRRRDRRAASTTASAPSPSKIAATISCEALGRRRSRAGSIRIESASSRDRSRRFSTSSSRRCDCCESRPRSSACCSGESSSLALVERLGPPRRSRRPACGARARPAPRTGPSARSGAAARRARSPCSRNAAMSVPKVVSRSISGRVEREWLAALVARHEAEASPLAEQRDDHERAEAEPLDDRSGTHVLAGGIRDVARRGPTRACARRRRRRRSGATDGSATQLRRRETVRRRTGRASRSRGRSGRCRRARRRSRRRPPRTPARGSRARGTRRRRVRAPARGVLRAECAVCSLREPQSHVRRDCSPQLFECSPAFPGVQACAAGAGSSPPWSRRNGG